MDDFEGTVMLVAADQGGMAMNVDVKAANGRHVTGWISIAQSIAREGLAVGLAALTSGKRISVRIDADADNKVATAVRVIS